MLSTISQEVMVMQTYNSFNEMAAANTSSPMSTFNSNAAPQVGTTEWNQTFKRLVAEFKAGQNTLPKINEMAEESQAYAQKLLESGKWTQQHKQWLANVNALIDEAKAINKNTSYVNTDVKESAPAAYSPKPLEPPTGTSFDATV